MLSLWLLCPSLCVPACLGEIQENWSLKDFAGWYVCTLERRERWARQEIEKLFSHDLTVFCLQEHKHMQSFRFATKNGNKSELSTLM